MSHNWIILKKHPKNVVKAILRNRKIKDEAEFLNPKSPFDFSFKEIGMSYMQLKKAQARINKAREEKQLVVIYGDYDVDGVCATTILWQTLNKIGLKVYPFIPDRFSDGYGMSVSGLKKIIKKYPDTKLIITVDNGIVAHEALIYAKKLKVDVIVTDHHEKTKKINSFATIHTTSVCGTAIAWFLCKFLLKEESEYLLQNLDLVGLATIADLMPLVGINRSLAVYGIGQIRKSERVGLIELCAESEINIEEVGAYEVGYVLGPRINASGRLADALTAVRLFCTKNINVAQNIASELTALNTKRQNILSEVLEISKSQEFSNLNIILVRGEFHEGVIGLAAGRLVEEYGKPAIVFSTISETVKASARSVPGFHITDFLRGASNLPINLGGHEMAAGLSIKHENLDEYLDLLSEKSKLIDANLLSKKRKVDCEIFLKSVNINLFNDLQKLEPFGNGNPRPTFLSRNVFVKEKNLIGKKKNHLKLQIQEDSKSVECLFFNAEKKASEFKIKDKLTVVYSIDKNTWNNVSKVQILLKDYIIDNGERTSRA